MADFQNIITCALAGFAISFGVIVLLLRSWKRFASHPRFAGLLPAREGGRGSVPPFGGVALMVAFVLPGMVLQFFFSAGVDASSHRVIFIGALAMGALGMWDDFQALRIKPKIAGQMLIASAVYFLGLGMHQFRIPLSDRAIDLGIYGWPVTVFWLLALTNIIRLIDGADGLAGVVALMLMILLSLISHAGDLAPLIAVGMGGALLAFLHFNLPPAKVRLGASGAYFLGFLIGSLSLYNSNNGKVVAALIAPLMVLTAPILDALLQALHRWRLGLPLFAPYGRRLHQRLLQSGLSREGLARGTYIFTTIFLILALVGFCWRGDSLPVVLSGSTLSLLWLVSQFTSSRDWFSGRAKHQKPHALRTDVQFALAQSDWLGMEGARGQSFDHICEDTAWIASKLGFARLRVHVDDQEKSWQFIPGDIIYPRRTNSDDTDFLVLTGPDGSRCQLFRHRVPGNTACWMELETPSVPGSKSKSPGATSSADSSAQYEIISQVLAEGWARSMEDWKRKKQT